jgi:uncharacterized membrane protein
MCGSRPSSAGSYAVLVLVSIGPGSHGDFVPHIGVTVTLGLMVAALGVLIHFIHHTATSIQLPQREHAATTTPG